MPAVQTTYNSRLSNGLPGQIANTEADTNVISRAVEGSSGIGFGIPVIRGTDPENQVKIGAAGTFVGITVRDPGGTEDKYAQYDTAAVLTRGVIWVTAGEAVTAGDAVYRTAAGALNKTSTSNTLIANAEWESSAASGALARIRLK